MTKETNHRYDVVLGLIVGLLVIAAIWGIERLYLVALGLGFLSIVSKKATFWISYLWLKIGYLMGRVNATLLLTLSYILILTPIGWLKKRFDPSFDFSKNTDGKNCLIEVNRKVVEEDFDKPW